MKIRDIIVRHYTKLLYLQNLNSTINFFIQLMILIILKNILKAHYIWINNLFELS